jgi:hypothetical protein
MGEARRWIRLEFPGQFVAIVGGAVAVAAAAAIVWAIARIRSQRLSRYALVAAAVTLAVAYSRWSALANPDSDVVERVLFVEYGLITWLFYRAWLPLGPAATLVLAFINAATVGTFEEWLQWLIPARVGEVRDIALNSAAIVSGLLFSMALQPLARPAADRRLRATANRRGQGRSGRAIRAVAMAVAIATAALAGFLGSAHLGHEIRDDQARTFRSIYSGDELRTLAARRQHE